MKKILFSLVASFAFVQSAQALTSPLNQSIGVYQSILNAINPLAVIPQDEYIVEIKRLTKGVDLGSEIHYLIKTVSGTATNSVNATNFSAELEENRFDMNCHRNHHHNHNTHRYDVVVSVTANPLIGPPIVQVISMTQRSTHSHTYSAEANALLF